VGAALGNKRISLTLSCDYPSSRLCFKTETTESLFSSPSLWVGQLGGIGSSTMILVLACSQLPLGHRQLNNSSLGSYLFGRGDSVLASLGNASDGFSRAYQARVIVGLELCASQHWNYATSSRSVTVWSIPEMNPRAASYSLHTHTTTSLLQDCAPIAAKVYIALVGHHVTAPRPACYEEQTSYLGYAYVRVIPFLWTPVVDYLSRWTCSSLD
jgi:hypothetical protein